MNDTTSSFVSSKHAATNKGSASNITAATRSLIPSATWWNSLLCLISMSVIIIDMVSGCGSDTSRRFVELVVHPLAFLRLEGRQGMNVLYTPWSYVHRI